MKVRVWNDNTLPHKELFRGETIEIGAQSYIEMERSEAHEFKTQFFAPKRSEKGPGGIDPSTLKMIRIEKIEGQAPAPVAPSFKSPLTGETFPNQKALDAHLEKNADKVHVDPEIEKEIAAAEAIKPRAGRKTKNTAA